MSVFHNNILAGASGAGGAGEATYVDDVFSTFLYDGTGASSNSINNGIDLDGEGGFVWGKVRNSGAGTSSHYLFDTERGVNKYLVSSSSDAETSSTNVLTSFNSNGFTVGGTSGNYDALNSSTGNFVSWTFRKAPGFFDVVTYTGNGTAGRTVSHNLGSTPGAIFIKKVNNSENWVVYHRSVGATQFLKLNENGAAATSSVIFNDTAPTSTEFTLGLNSQVNENGDTYVAYVFAHDDQSFGDNSDEAIIKCGSYSGTGSAGNSITLGFEPQWLMVKRTDGAGSWFITDTMRGMTAGDGYDPPLLANSTDFESNNDSMKLFAPTPTGFECDETGYNTNGSGATYIYIAIRRPHKPPEAGTDVFKAVTYSGSSSAQTITGAGFAPDWMWSKDRGVDNNGWYHDRVRGVYSLDSSGNGGEQDRSAYIEVLGQDGVEFVQGGFDLNRNGSNHVALFMKRAPGFFDVVTYTGTGSSSSNTGQQNITHNLGAVPELIIVKVRDATNDWVVYNSASGAGNNMRLNRTNGNMSDIYAWDNTTPTSSVFRVGSDISAPTNSNTKKFVAYLFASLDGISKIGTYSGSSSAVTVDCGFSSGPRFIMIKATNRSEPWYVFDSARGIVSGNDPHFQLQSTAAENTGDDVIDPTSSGFTVNTGYGSGFNESGNTYLFFAIA